MASFLRSESTTTTSTAMIDPQRSLPQHSLSQEHQGSLRRKQHHRMGLRMSAPPSSPLQLPAASSSKVEEDHCSDPHDSTNTYHDNAFMPAPRPVSQPTTTSIPITAFQSHYRRRSNPSDNVPHKPYYDSIRPKKTRPHSFQSMPPPPQITGSSKNKEKRRSLSPAFAPGRTSPFAPLALPPQESAIYVLADDNDPDVDSQPVLTPPLTTGSSAASTPAASSATSSRTSFSGLRPPKMRLSIFTSAGSDAEMQTALARDLGRSKGLEKYGMHFWGLKSPIKVRFEKLRSGMKKPWKRY